MTKVLCWQTVYWHTHAKQQPTAHKQRLFRSKTRWRRLRLDCSLAAPTVRKTKTIAGFLIFAQNSLSERSRDVQGLDSDKRLSVTPHSQGENRFHRKKTNPPPLFVIQTVTADVEEWKASLLMIFADCEEQAMLIAEAARQIAEAFVSKHFSADFCLDLCYRNSK